jgi:hypothetical protein
VSRHISFPANEFRKHLSETRLMFFRQISRIDDWTGEAPLERITRIEKVIR